MPFFWPKGIANAFLFTWNGKFSLTIGMIMPLGWGEVTGIIPKLVTQGPFWFPTRHLWLRHLWLMGNPNGLSWLVGNYFFPFTRGKPLMKGKSPCIRLSLKALRHSCCISTKSYETSISINSFLRWRMVYHSVTICTRVWSGILKYLINHKPEVQKSTNQ